LTAIPESPSPPPVQQSRWRALAGDPIVAAIFVYALLAMGASVAAYLSVFTVWQGYDDEGTVLVTLQAFARGDTLYNDVYTPYGPFYYELFGGLFALTGQDVTTDTSRSIVIVLWVATSFLVGLTCHRLSGRLALGATGMVTAFTTLYVLSNEPMHPQVLCVLLFGAFFVLAVFGPGRRPLWSGAAAGVLLAMLLLTKVNLGVYAIAAVVLAAALTVEPLRRRRWLSWPAVAAVLVLPIVVIARDLDATWARDLVGVHVLALAAIVVVAWSLAAHGRDDEDDGSGMWLLGGIAGFAFAFIAILGAILLNGSGPSDVYDGVITEALRVRDVITLEFPMSPVVVDWAIAALAAAAVTVRLRRAGGGEPSPWPGLIRAAAGLAIWLSLARIAPLALEPSAGNSNSLPTVLAWIAVIPPAGVAEARWKRFLRVLLPTLAVLEAMQAYPVAGSQLGIASLIFVPVGGLLLADALTSMRAWSASRGDRALERFGIVAAVAVIALAVDFTINVILRPIGTNAVVYRDNQEVPFSGSGQLRLPPAYAADYTRLVDLLHRHRCTDFIGYPNVNSLYIWSGIEPPPPVAPGAWIQALDRERQQRIVDELRRSPRPCAIRNDELAAYWLREDASPDRPLVDYVLDNFRIVDETGEFKFMLPVEGDAGRREPG
jgi:hypothetical protein